MPLRNMANNKNYILWSEGDLTSFGELVGTSEDGKKLVKNPAYVTFELVAEDKEDKKDGLKKLVYHWQARFGAYLPQPAIKFGDNVWKVNAKHVLGSDTVLQDGIIEDYKAQLGLKD